MTRRVVVIGGGPAGIEAAAAAAQGGASVTLVSEGSIGGRAGWDSLVPSKVWIGAADLVGELHGAGARGVTGLPTPRLEPAAVLARIRETARLWGDQEARRLAELGVRFVSGLASFAGPGRLSVRGGEGEPPKRLDADAIIIAAGSAPRFPPAMRPDGKRMFAPRFMTVLEQQPADLVVVGGGATSSEFASLFSRLGVRVPWCRASTPWATPRAARCSPTGRWRRAGSRAATPRGLATAPYRPETVVHAVYSDPEVAQVGDVEAGASDLGRVRVPFAAGLKAHLLHDGGGWLELTYDLASGRVRGSVAVGPHAWMCWRPWPWPSSSVPR